VALHELYVSLTNGFNSDSETANRTCRKVDLRPDEILTSVHVPWTQDHEFVQAFKQAHRREDDIALVNAGMRLQCCMDSDANWVVKEASIAFGGIAATVVQCTHTAAALKGCCLGKQALQVRSGASCSN
jgi:xanthine dehydrogenase/oxidase